MQTPRQTRCEVGIDLSLSILVNIGAQLLVYGALATAGRSLAFAALVLGIAMPRRYATRRLFNAWFSPGGRQLPWQSWLEVSLDTVLGFCVAIVLQWLFYGEAATWAKAGGLTAVLYTVTLGRRYLLRRWFESWSARQSAASARGRPLSTGEEQVFPRASSSHVGHVSQVEIDGE